VEPGNNNNNACKESFETSKRHSAIKFWTHRIRKTVFTVQLSGGLQHCRSTLQPVRLAQARKRCCMADHQQHMLIYKSWGRTTGQGWGQGWWEEGEIGDGDVTGHERVKDLYLSHVVHVACMEAGETDMRKGRWMFRSYVPCT
jgi:hypothetical protein